MAAVLTGALASGALQNNNNKKKKKKKKKKCTHKSTNQLQFTIT
jgi:hypothetical protein